MIRTRKQLATWQLNWRLATISKMLHAQASTNQKQHLNLQMALLMKLALRKAIRNTHVRPKNAFASLWSNHQWISFSKIMTSPILTIDFSLIHLSISSIYSILWFMIYFIQWKSDNRKQESLPNNHSNNHPNNHQNCMRLISTSF